MFSLLKNNIVTELPLHRFICKCLSISGNRISGSKEHTLKIVIDAILS